jgi:hypothetical protein
MATRTRDPILSQTSVIDDTVSAKPGPYGESGVLFSDDHRKWQDDGYRAPN